MVSADKRGKERRAEKAKTPRVGENFLQRINRKKINDWKEDKALRKSIEGDEKKKKKRNGK